MIFYSLQQLLADFAEAVFKTVRCSMQMRSSLAISIVVMQDLYLTPGMYAGSSF